MNILKNISVKGEVFAEYAFLSLDFQFESGCQDPASAEYIFTLPKDSAISDMKIVTAEGQIIRTTVTSMSHAEKIYASAEASAVLRLLGDSDCLLSLGGIANGSCRILLNIYVSLPKSDFGRQLVIPLAVSEYGTEERFCRAKVELTLRSDDDLLTISSSTHKIKNVRSRFLWTVTTDEISADRDFCLSICGGTEKNSAIAVTSDFRGEILCRLYPNWEGLSAADAENVCAYAGGTEARIIETPVFGGSVTLYSEYTESNPPESFEVKIGDTAQVFAVNDIPVYKSFAPIRLACAKAEQLRLEKELAGCRPSEVREIRRRMEELGVNFSVLNSETAMLAVLPSGKTAAMRVIIPNTKNVSGFEPENGLSETNNAALTENRRKMAVSFLCGIIAAGMHANGAVCANGEINPEICRRQTLVCLLALIAAGMGGEYADFIGAGAEYLNGCTQNGLYLTKDAAEARAVLTGLFGSEPEPVAEAVPDLLTAARMVWKI